MPIDKTSAQVRRPLTDDEIGRILAGIDAATSTRSLLAGTIRAVFTALLAGTGARLEEFGPHRPLDPAGFAIPTSQWQAIVAAITDRAAQWGTGPILAFELVGLMPAFYNDPDVPAPAIPRIDRRPGVHQLHVTREAVDVIAACEDHIRALATCFGHGSREHLEALTSWHEQLARLFGMGLGANTRVSVDGRLSLFVTTGSGVVFAVIFHGAHRHCTTRGCQALIGDDGTAYPAHTGAAVASHEHTLSYPLDAPQPGRWSFHS